MLSRAIFTFVALALLLPVSGSCSAAPATPNAKVFGQLMQNGHNDLQKGQPAAAVGHYRSAVYINPNDAYARKCFAYALVASGHPHEGAQQMELAIGLANPTVADWNFVADAHARSGDLRRAMQSLQHALQLEPNNALLLVSLAEVQKKAGLTKEARSAAAKALALASSDQELKKRAMEVLTDQPLGIPSTIPTSTPASTPTNETPADS